MSDLPSFRRESTTLLRLAGPLIVAQLSQVGMGFTDTIMAGRLSALDLAAVAIGSMLMLGVYLFFFGVLNAASPTIAQHKGGGRNRQVGETFRQALWLAAALAVLSVPAMIYSRYLMWLVGTADDVADLAGGYLFAVAWGMPATCIFFVGRFATEGIGSTRPVMYINLFGLALNALANYAFMFGNFGAPALGAVGCGVATALVMWIDTFLLMLYLALHRRYRHYELYRNWRPPDWAVIAGFIRLGAPISISIMSEVMLFLGVGLMMSRLGSVAMAAHQVAMNFTALVFMVPLSTGIAIMIRVGHLVGAGDVRQAQRTSHIGVSMCAVFMVIMASVMLLVPERITLLYTADAAVTALAVQLFFFAALMQFSDGVNIALVHVLRGLKDTFVPMLFGLFTNWLVGLTTAWFLGIYLGIGPAGLWSGLICGLSLSCVVVFFRSRLVFRRLLPDDQTPSLDRKEAF